MKALVNQKEEGDVAKVKKMQLAVWQGNNCSRCMFADPKKVGTGAPCCIRVDGPDPLGAICLGRREK
ncbi:MAG TPA: hypothetical protein VMW45_00230 [Dehalococcoidia bacterium]|nr:hypothetical protein [Dehalococcoidia bacterium]